MISSLDATTGDSRPANPAPNNAQALADGLVVTARAAARISAILREDPSSSVFRIGVKGGGCSGFEYELGLDKAVAPEDRIFARDGVSVVVDDVSMPFLTGATLDWVEELLGSQFRIKNPNARSSCGCGISFSV